MSASKARSDTTPALCRPPPSTVTDHFPASWTTETDHAPESAREPSPWRTSASTAARSSLSTPATRIRRAGAGRGDARGLEKDGVGRRALPDAPREGRGSVGRIAGILCPTGIPWL